MSGLNNETVANCTNDALKWSYNSIGQDPCWIAAYLASACTGTPPALNFALPPTWHYFGPYVSTATPCKCSTVYYSVLSACALCQYGDSLTWSQWSVNCSYTWNQVFPAPIPPGTRVPRYAYLAIGIDDKFNANSAQAAKGGPESTGVKAAQTVISVLPNGATTTFPLNGPTDVSKNGKSSAAIAGGVVSGVVGLLLIAALAIFIFRRRSARFKAPSSLIDTSIHPMRSSSGKLILIDDHTGGASTYFAPTVPASAVTRHHTGSSNSSPPAFPVALRLYDPSDPSTFPAPLGGKGTPTRETHNFNRMGNQDSGNARGYHGSAEL